MLKFVAPAGSFVRPLTHEESWLLKGALSWRKQRVQRMTWTRSLLITFLVVGAFCVPALVAMIAKHQVSWKAIGGLGAAWVGLGSLIWLLSFPSRRRDLRKQQEELGMFQDACNRNQGVVVRINSEQMVEFEEQEDEGACYAFQLPDDRIIFVFGQDYYPTARFPNSDFSPVHIVNGDGDLLEMFITKHGRKLKPARTISAKAKAPLRIPAHLEIIPGRLQDLEHLLAGTEK